MVNKSKVELLVSFPISNTSVTHNFIIPSAQVKTVGAIPYTLSHTPLSVCLGIQLVLTSKYIHNPNIFQWSYCYQLGAWQPNLKQTPDSRFDPISCSFFLLTHGHIYVHWCLSGQQHCRHLMLSQEIESNSKGLGNLRGDHHESRSRVPWSKLEYDPGESTQSRDGSWMAHTRSSAEVDAEINDTTHFSAPFFLP